MKLATLSQLKSHLGIPQADTSKDTVLDFLLEGVSGSIETMTSRRFELQSHSLKLSGDGFDSLVLPHYPIHVENDVVMITELTLDGVAIALTTLDIEADGAILYRKAGVWNLGRRNIEITYSAGYKLAHTEEVGNTDAATVPAELQLATVRIAARVYERKTAEGVSSVSPASFTVNYKDYIDPDVKAMIDGHTRIRF